LKEIEIIVRPYKSEIDDNYIYSTWTKHSWYSASEKPSIPKREFFRQKIEEIKNILTDGDIKIACFKNDPSAIMGFVALYNGKIAWLCIKKDYHKEGIDKLLMKSVEDKLDEQEK
jgi:hypothetical protein